MISKCISIIYLIRITEDLGIRILEGSHYSTFHQWNIRIGIEYNSDIHGNDC